MCLCALNCGHLRCYPGLSWHALVQTYKLLQCVVIHTRAGQPPARCCGLLHPVLGLVLTDGM